MTTTSATPIRIGIVGYGNLGRGVQAAIGHNPDMTLVGVWTRRDPDRVDAGGAPVHGMADLMGQRDRIDVLVLCGGSRDDLPTQSPELAAHFNIVDSYDNHAHIPEHFAAVDRAARAAGTTALISAGWDPGLFSVNRVMGEALLPDGATYTFWGKGLSQGHSAAVRNVPGVADAVQYTIPAPAAIDAVRSGTRPTLSTRQKHLRECFVVLADGADADAVRRAIVTMPDYFEPYDTTVHFIDAAQMARDHQAMPHGGFVIRSGNTSPENAQVVEYRLQLGSNPEFTASALTAYARAVHRMHQHGAVGAKTVFDVAPGWLSPRSAADLRASEL